MLRIVLRGLVLTIIVQILLLTFAGDSDADDEHLEADRVSVEETLKQE